LINERVSLPLEAVFDAAGKAYRQGEIRERISVTVRQRERVPQTAGVILRMGTAVVPAAAPAVPEARPEAGEGGAAPVQVAEPARVRVVMIEAGELRVLVRDREATAWLTWNDTTIWRSTLGAGAIGPQVTRLIGQLPLAGLALAEWEAGAGGGGGGWPVLVPQVGAGGEAAEGVWEGATASVHDAQAPIVLTGRTRYGPMTALLDQQTSRVRQFGATISGSGTVLELEIVPISAEKGGAGGDVAGDAWMTPPSEAGRTRVASVRELGKKVEAPAPGPVPAPAPAPTPTPIPAPGAVPAPTTPGATVEPQPRPQPQPSTPAPVTP
jgi:hypothetical protein